MKISFSPPDIDENDILEVADALRSGWITTGPRTKSLEKKIKDKIGSAMCVCLNSQTACAEMSLRVLGIGAGDEVITCAYTYTATASVVCHVGAQLKLADVIPGTVEIDYDKIEALITEKTKVIIPVDLGGVPCDYDRLFDIVERKKSLFKPSNDIQKAFGRIIIMADTAHAFGSVYKGKYAGNVADISNFSFHAVKNFTTAEGGCCSWRAVDGVDSEEIYKKYQLLSLHGQNKDALSKTKPGAWEYDIIGTWYKCNMTDVAAAMGIRQFDRYGDMLARRKSIIEKYDNAFRPFGIKTLEHYGDDYSSSGHLYITRVPYIDVEDRNDIISKMAERGIACNVHYKPLPMHTAYKALGFDIKDFPYAYESYKNEITLPLHTCLTDEQVDYIIKEYSDIVKEYIK